MSTRITTRVFSRPNDTACHPNVAPSPYGIPGPDIHSAINSNLPPVCIVLMRAGRCSDPSCRQKIENWQQIAEIPEMRRIYNRYGWCPDCSVEMLRDQENSSTTPGAPAVASPSPVVAFQ